jgi:hypothetical protein
MYELVLSKQQDVEARLPVVVSPPKSAGFVTAETLIRVR